MATALELINKRNEKTNIFIIEIGMNEAIKESPAYLWNYEPKKSSSYEMYEGVVISAPDYNTANTVFLDLLRKDTDNTYLYEGTEWYCRCEGSDFYPGREDKVVLAAYIHP